MVNFKDRFRAAGIHFALSLAIAAAAGLLTVGGAPPDPLLGSDMHGPTDKAWFDARTDPPDLAWTLSGHLESTTLWVPMTGRKSFWTALVDGSSGRPVAFLPLDSF